MIRINLLPHKRETRREGGQGWLLLVMILVAAEIVVLGLFHQIKLQELAKQRERNTELQDQISKIESTVKNQKAVKEELASIRAKETAIHSLQAARSGPTAIMLELSRVLTPEGGPTVDPEKLNQMRKDNPQNVHNPAWDARRLWLNSFKEHQRTVKLVGYARDGDDVAELARRLDISRYFGEVTLLPAKEEKDKTTKLKRVKFQLQAKVRY